MNRPYLKIFILSLAFILSCATAGQKYIHIDYTGTAAPSFAGAIGISPVIDNRNQALPAQVGYRILMDNSQETYLVTGMDLGKALTNAAQRYLEQKGYQVNETGPWDLSPEAVSKMNTTFASLVTGTINQFECRAKKKGGHTTMTLDINMTLYVGNPKAGSLKTIPVTFSLEKTIFTFSRQKLETFINDSLAEIFEKGLVL